MKRRPAEATEMFKKLSNSMTKGTTATAAPNTTNSSKHTLSRLLENRKGSTSIKEASGHPETTENVDTVPDMLKFLVENDENRRDFKAFLHEYKNAMEQALMLFMFITSLANSKADRDKTKLMIQRAQKFFENNRLESLLSESVGQKMAETLKRNTYHESVFKAAENEIKSLLEPYFRQFFEARASKSTTTATHRLQPTQNGHSEDPRPEKSSKRTTHKLNRTSLNPLVQSTRNQLNESRLSLKVATASATPSTYLPPNPYSVPSRPLPASCQDSELQSMVSVEVGAEQHSRYKLDPVQKKSLQANRHFREPSLLDFSRLTISDPPPPPFAQDAAGAKFHHRRPPPEQLEIKQPSEFMRELNAKLEHLIVQSGQKVVYDPDFSPKPRLKISSWEGAPPFEAWAGHGLDIDSMVLEPPFHQYQRTSKSKEVDIDSQGQHLATAMHHHHHHHHYHPKPGLAASNDSGISTRGTKSSDSMERVHDWLGNKVEPPSNAAAEQTPSKGKAANPKRIAPQAVDLEKTVVAYQLPGEELPFITSFKGASLTLAQFKQLLTKKGNYRYFFKTLSDLLGEETVVFEEVTDDNQAVPMFKGKVIGKIEQIFKA